MKNISIVLFFTLFLTGCVTGTRNLDNLAVPDFSAEKSASGDIYIAEILDNRVFEQKPRDPSTPSVRGNLNKTSKEKLATLIGRQRNGYGGAMGDVALPNGGTVQDKVRDLLVAGLESRGYTVVDDSNAPNRLNVSVEKFWAWFTPGFVSVSFESNLQCEIEFETSSQTQKIAVQGYGLNKGQIASNANWELAYKRAFEDFLQNLDSTLDQNKL